MDGSLHTPNQNAGTSVSRQQPDQASQHEVQNNKEDDPQQHQTDAHHLPHRDPEEELKEKQRDKIRKLTRRLDRQTVLTNTEQQLETQSGLMKSTIISSIGAMSTALTTYSKYNTKGSGTVGMKETTLYLIAIFAQAYVSFIILGVLMMDLTKYRRQRLKGSKESPNLAPFLCIILVLLDMALNIWQIVLMNKLEENFNEPDKYKFPDPPVAPDFDWVTTCKDHLESIQEDGGEEYGIPFTDYTVNFDSNNLGYGVTLFMAVVSVLVDTVEIASSLFGGDYSEQIKHIAGKVWDGVPPLPKGGDENYKGILDDDENKKVGDEASKSRAQKQQDRKKQIEDEKQNSTRKGRCLRFLTQLSVVFVSCMFFVCPVYFGIFFINFWKRVIGQLTKKCWRKCFEKKEKPPKKDENKIFLFKKQKEDAPIREDDEQPIPPDGDEHVKPIYTFNQAGQKQKNEFNEGGAADQSSSQAKKTTEGSKPEADEEDEKLGCWGKIQKLLAEARYQLDIVFIESSPALSFSFKEFAQSFGRSIASIKAKPPAYQLLGIKIEPNMGIDEFQSKIDELFFTFDKDDSLFLDQGEFKEFQKALNGLCDECLNPEHDKQQKEELKKNPRSPALAKYGFGQFYFDDKKRKVLDDFLQKKLDELKDIEEKEKDRLRKSKTMTEDEIEKLKKQKLELELGELQDYLKQNMFETKTEKQENQLQNEFIIWKHDLREVDPKDEQGKESGQVVYFLQEPPADEPKDKQENEPKAAQNAKPVKFELKKMKRGEHWEKRAWYILDPFDTFKWQEDAETVKSSQKWKEESWEKRKDIRWEDFRDEEKDVRAFADFREEKDKYPSRETLSYSDWQYVRADEKDCKKGDYVKKFQEEKEDPKNKDNAKLKLLDFPAWINQLEDKDLWKKQKEQKIINQEMTFEQWQEAKEKEYNDWKAENEKRKDLTIHYLKPFKHQYELFIEYQKWRETLWDVRQYFTLSIYEKQKQAFFDWQKQKPNERAQFTLGVWTEYDKKVYSFAEFRESDLKRREVYSIKEWANQEDDIKDLTAFKEKNWNSRQQYKLANWKLTKEKIKSFEQTLDVDRPKRQHVTFEYWLKDENKVKSYFLFREGSSQEHFSRRSHYTIEEWFRYDQQIKELQTFKEHEWLSRKKFELADWLEKPKSEELQHLIWQDENPERRGSFTLEEHWKPHKTQLKAFHTFRDEKWDTREGITFEQWLSSLEIIKWQQFKEVNWQARTRFSLKECNQHQDAVVRLAEWSEQAWDIRQGYSLSQWIESETKIKSFEAWNEEVNHDRKYSFNLQTWIANELDIREFVDWQQANTKTRGSWPFKDWLNDKVKLQELVKWQERTTLTEGVKVSYWERRKKYGLDIWKEYEAQLKKFVHWQDQDYENRQMVTFFKWLEDQEFADFFTWQNARKERKKWTFDDWKKDKIALTEMQNWIEKDLQARQHVTLKDWIEKETLDFQLWQNNDLLNRTGYTFEQYQKPESQKDMIIEGWNTRIEIEGRGQTFTPEQLEKEADQVVDYIQYVERNYETRKDLPFVYNEQRERTIGVCLKNQKQDLTFPENPSFGCELLGVVGSLGQTDMNFIFQVPGNKSQGEEKMTKFTHITKNHERNPKKDAKTEPGLFTKVRKVVLITRENDCKFYGFQLYDSNEKLILSAGDASMNHYYFYKHTYVLDSSERIVGFRATKDPNGRAYFYNFQFLIQKDPQYSLKTFNWLEHNAQLRVFQLQREKNWEYLKYLDFETWLNDAECVRFQAWLQWQDEHGVVVNKRGTIEEWQSSKHYADNKVREDEIRKDAELKGAIVSHTPSKQDGTRLLRASTIYTPKNADTSLKKRPFTQN